MVSKTITLREEAYSAFKSLQLKGESFSDTILRLKRHYSDLTDFIGQGTKTQAEYEKELQELEIRRENFFSYRFVTK